MNNDFDIYKVVIAGFVVLGGGGLVTGYLGVGDLVVAGVLVGAVLLASSSLKKKTLQEQFQSLTNDSGSGASMISYEEGKQVANDWAKNQFKGGLNSKTGIRIDQTRSESEPTLIVTDPSEMDFIYVRHYYVTHGDKNQPMDVFVDVSNGEYFAHKQVKKKRTRGSDVNPFKKLDSYRMTQRLIRSGRFMSETDDKGLDARQLQGIPMGFQAPPQDQGGNQG